MERFSKLKDFILNNKLKAGLIAAVLATTIGYAAVNTALNINGLVQLKRDSSLKVFISSLTIDGIDMEKSISDDRESFKFKQSQIKEDGTSTINYQIKNAMNDYDVLATISCSPEFNNNTVIHYNAEEVTINTNTSISDKVEAVTTFQSNEKLYDKIKAQNKGADSLINFNAISSASNGLGVYSTTNTDSGKEVYFYRGAVTNNNVIFAGYCWKIIRTTETGGVKLLYNGVPSGGQCGSLTGSGIGKYAFQTESKDNAYAGYMYGSVGASSYENTHKNTHDSQLKQRIDEWYKNNIYNTEYESYLEDTVWCNDRSVVSGTGYGTTATTYAFYKRLGSGSSTPNATPTLKCANSNDRFTTSTANGNGALTYPIATITGDEVVYAGATGGADASIVSPDNTSYYLYVSDGDFHTMTPIALYSGSIRSATLFSTGGISQRWTDVASRTFGTRPAISLKADVEISSGTGETNNPYIIGNNNDNGNTQVTDDEYTCKIDYKLKPKEERVIGNEYCFGTECFNVIGYDGTNYTLLAKYNLNVGSNPVPNAVTGIQNSNSLGDITTEKYGTIAYGSTNDYSTSNAKKYVDSYISYLNVNYNLEASGRLITLEELEKLGCVAQGSNGCSASLSKYTSWLLNTTFFTMSADPKNPTNNTRVLLVGADGFFGGSAANTDGLRGVRPVIIVPYSKIELETKPEEPSNQLPEAWQDNGVFSEYYTKAYSKLQTMSNSEKIGQLLVMTHVSSDSLNAVKNYNLSGVVFYETDFEGKTISQVQSMTSSLQEQAKIPLLLAVDEEGGRVVRLSSNTNLINTELTQYPELFFTNSNNKNAWKLASTLYAESGNNFNLITREEQIRNAFIRKLGLNINFAPVVDIASPPAYISDRSFGTDPALVSEYAKAVINAGKGSGVSHALKHFPGYGNNQDTHTSSSVDETSMEELNNIHLKPFVAGIEAGAQAVMISHNTVSALDKDYPASLSSTVHELLFNDLGFTGVAITDDLSMDAVGNKYSKQYLKAFQAGNHILLTSTQYATAHNEILTALQNGEITQDDLDKRVFKVLAWKYYNGIITD